MNYTTIPPNGDGDEAGITLLFFTLSSFVLAAITIALRLWVRRMRNQPLAVSDWLLILGWVFSLGLTIVIVLFVGYCGLGQHRKNVSRDSIILMLKLFPAAEILWAAANTATKVSILLVYKDIFVTKRFRILADSMIVISILLAIGNTIQCLAICRPFYFQWDKSIEGGVCGNRNLGILLVAFMNLATDIIIVLMPMPLVWNLKMARSKRLALMGMFGFGIIICIITTFRIIFTFRLIRDPHNSTYWVAIAAIFFALEPNLGMVNACLLLLRPLLQRIRPKLDWNPHDSGSPDYSLKNSQSLGRPRT